MSEVRLKKDDEDRDNVERFLTMYGEDEDDYDEEALEELPAAEKETGVDVVDEVMQEEVIKAPPKTCAKKVKGGRRTIFGNVSQDLYSKIKAAAEQHGMSMALMVCQTLEAYFDDYLETLE
jgi:hypothetical protein